VGCKDFSVVPLRAANVQQGVARGGTRGDSGLAEKGLRIQGFAMSTLDIAEKAVNTVLKLETSLPTTTRTGQFTCAYVRDLIKFSNRGNGSVHAGGRCGR
jgi:hypothetical protein